jgi:3-oxoacyl-[acyl-carrier-protein] synthase II
MGKRRVAVTGAGVISPLGCTFEDFHRALCDARPGIRRLAPEIAQNSGAQVGALIDWKPAGLFAEAEAANLDRASQFAVGAATQAIAASGLDVTGAPERVGVY